MKILYIAPTSDFANQVHAALATLGHTVVFLDDRLDYSLPTCLRGSRLLWRLSRRIPGLRRRANDALQHELLRAAVGCDVVVAGKGMNIVPTTLAELKNRRVRTAVWFPDNAVNEPYASWVSTVGPLWDHFFSFDSAIAQQIPAHNTHTLPFAVDVSYVDVGIITDEDRQRYACDVCFIGAPYPDRVELLSRIQDVDLRIWGWKGWEKTSLAQYYRGPLTARESAKAYRLAKISVNTNVRPMTRGVNLKTFEICAAEGFQITDAPADLARLFHVGSELVVFQNADDFETLVRHWLAHPSERTHVAQAGYERVLQDHTLAKRLSEMIDIIKT